MKTYLVVLAIIIAGVLLTMLPDKKGGKKDDNPKSTQMGGNKSKEI